MFTFFLTGKLKRPSMPRSRLSTALLVVLTALIVGLAFLAQDRANLAVLTPVALAGGGVLFWLWQRNDVSMGQVLLFAVVFMSPLPLPKLSSR